MEVRSRSLNIFLLCCVFLFVCTEVLLSPFYPQFFKKVFGITDPDLTGYYVMTCRLAVVIFTPIWGSIAKKRQNSATLLVIGQGGTGLSCFLMALSPSFEMFLASSVLLLLFKSSYFLLYTIIMEQNRGGTTGAAARYHAVLQGAIVTAAVCSGWVIQMENPLLIFWLIGAFECLLGLISYFMFKKIVYKKDSSKDGMQGNEDHSISIPFLKLGMAVLTLHLALNMIRPFFTVYTESVYHTHPFTSGLLYLIPSLMAIAVLPLIQKYSERMGWNGYVAGAVMMIAGVFLQGIETGVAGLVVFRCLFGVGAAWCLAKLDVLIFQSSQNLHGDYSKISAVQNIGLLLAPVAASSIISHRSNAEVFFYASLLGLLHLVVFFWITFMSKRTAGQIHLHKEEKHALSK
jgi:hypothetical protein